MRLTCFQHYRNRAIGALLDDGRLLDLAAAAAAWLCLERADPMWEGETALRLPADVGLFLAGGGPGQELAAAAIRYAMASPNGAGIGGEPLFVDRDAVRILPPLIAPLILSSGARFLETPDEFSGERRSHREFYMRNPGNVQAATDPIILPTWLGDGFYVAPRLAIVIGTRLREATRAEADAGIYGFCPAAEICLRDLQSLNWAGPMFHVQYPHARAFDGSLRLGMSIVSRQAAAIEGDRTGSVRIDGELVHEVLIPGHWPTLVDWVCELSEIVTLEPGTLLMPGAADDIVVRPAPAMTPRLALESLTPAQPGLLRSGAEVVVAIDGFDPLRMHTA